MGRTNSPFYVGVPSEIDDGSANVSHDSPLNHHRVATLDVPDHHAAPSHDHVRAPRGPQDSLETPLHAQETLELETPLGRFPFQTNKKQDKQLAKTTKMSYIVTYTTKKNIH